MTLNVLCCEKREGKKGLIISIMDMAILMANTEHLFAFRRQDEEQKTKQEKRYYIKFPPFLGMASFICCWLYSWNNLYLFFILCFIYPRDSTLLPLLLVFHLHFILCLLGAFCLIILSFFFFVVVVIVVGIRFSKDYLV